MSPGAVTPGGVCVSPGAGDVTPHVGISPASAIPVGTHVNAIVIKNLFIDVSPVLRVKAMQTFLHRIGSDINARGLAGLLAANYYPVCNRTYSHLPPFSTSHANRPSEAGN